MNGSIMPTALPFGANAPCAEQRRTASAILRSSKLLTTRQKNLNARLANSSRLATKRGCCAFASLSNPKEPTTEPYDPKDGAAEAIGLPGSRRGASGRRAHRCNPLGHSALLSSYNAKALRMAPELLRLDLLAQRTGYSFAHKEVPVLALMHPRVTVSGHNLTGLTHSHLAVLGEDLLRLAAVELTWTALEDAPDAETAAAPARLPPATDSTAVVAEAVTELLHSLGYSAAQAAAAGAAAAAAAHTAQSEGRALVPSAALLNRAAATVAGGVQLLPGRWRLEEHMYGFHQSGAPPGKHEKATCAKALLAAMYLDGGYAEGLRDVMAPVVAEMLQGAGGERDSDLQEVGRRLARLQPGKDLPRGADDLHTAAPAPPPAASPAAVGAAAAGGQSSSHQKQQQQQQPPQPPRWAPSSSSWEVLPELHGPPPYPRSSPAAHLASLLEGLRTHGDGYQPRDVAAFLALTDLWYGYLVGFRGSLMGRPHPSGEARQRTVAEAASRARALITLGRAVYGVVVSELLLERSVASLGPEQHPGVGDMKQRRQAADQVRQEREGLMADRMRLEQMDVGLGLKLGAAGVADGGEEEGGEEGAGCRPAVVEGSGSLLAKCADGVLGAVMLEGGMRHARTVARGLIVAGEVKDLVRRMGV